ncbi:MAG: hypothetical protein JNL61_03825 [Rhizobiaceae bacterium]|nr:hypothetical protein [Rhizobiaceae bacterium]
MDPEDEWKQIRSDRLPMASLGVSALRLALLFGSAAIAIALILVPMVDGPPRSVAGTGDLDMMSTGSIRQAERYTLRRSVLQPSNDAVCIIRADGTRSGDC